MARLDGPYLYLATDGRLSKIGIASNVERRMLQLRSPRPGHRVALFQSWFRPNDCRKLEGMIKGLWLPCHGTEWFDISTDEVLAAIDSAMAGTLRTHRMTPPDEAWAWAREELKRYGTWVIAGRPSA